MDVKQSVDISRNAIPGKSFIQKFGKVIGLGTTAKPIALGGVYQTPTTAQSLEIISDDANDTIAGTGARRVLVQGLDSNFNLQEEIVSMNGTTAVPLSKQFIRVFRAYVYESGSYADCVTTFSHAGEITVRGAGAGVLWIKIGNSSSVSRGQSQCSCYTVPRGFTAYIIHQSISIKTNQSADIFFFKREGANIISAPYKAARIIDEKLGVVDEFSHEDYATERFKEMTDIGMLARATASTIDITAEFDLVLYDNNIYKTS